MEREPGQDRAHQQSESDRQPQREQRPAPGKVTRTSKLSQGRAAAVQQQASRPGVATTTSRARSLWDFTMDPFMDMAHRGLAALPERDPDAVDDARGAG